MLSVACSGTPKNRGPQHHGQCWRRNISESFHGSGAQRSTKAGGGGGGGLQPSRDFPGTAVT